LRECRNQHWQPGNTLEACGKINRWQAPKNRHQLPIHTAIAYPGRVPGGLTHAVDDISSDEGGVTLVTRARGPRPLPGSVTTIPNRWRRVSPACRHG